MQGKGTQSIANTLNAEGRRTLTGGPWYSQTVARILDNEKYCGDLLLQKTYVPDHIRKGKKSNTGQLTKYLIENNHEAIIEKATFLQTAAERSGISLKAIRNLEAGENASTLSLLSYCRTLRKTDWLMTLAPPEINDALFERRFAQKGRRQRAGRTPREATHG